MLTEDLPLGSTIKANANMINMSRYINEKDLLEVTKERNLITEDKKREEGIAQET
jgi:hypothetical protein